MNQWAFVLAAFGVMTAGTGGLVAWSWAAMRSAEARAEALGKRQ